MSGEIRLPVEVVFRNMDQSQVLEDKVRERAQKLTRYFDRIMHCHVVIEADHRRHHKGNLYQVRIDLTVPNRELAVSRDPGNRHAHEDPYVAVRDAFDAMGKQLQAYAAKQRGEVKQHETPPHGRIIELAPATGYGVILAADGREVAFTRASVVDYDFDKLEGGESVRFAEVQGEDGPVASTVHVEGKHHVVG
ncbi:MAG: HPF/RaiA family ribosome-associated protein [Pseudomonadota bacterium]